MKPFSRAAKFSKRDFARPERRAPSRDRREAGRSEDTGSRRPEGRFQRRDTGARRDEGSSGGNRPNLEFHEITCDNCGKISEVPFKPSGNKPVYCRDCYNKNNSAESGSRPGDRRESRSQSDSSSSGELDKINRKLDKIMRALKIE